MDVLRPLRARLARLPLTVVFGVSSLLVVSLVAVGLHGVLRTMIVDRAVQDTVRSSQFVTRVALEPLLGAAAARGALEDGEIERADAAVASGLQGRVLSRLKVFGRDGRIVYSDDHRLIGTGGPASARLRGVMDGDRPDHHAADTAQADHRSEGGLGALMEVYVPLHRPGAAGVVGAAELYVPFDPVEADIAADTRRLVGFLLGGLALLWATLFRLVLVVSRRLRREVDQNEHQAAHDALTGLPNRLLLGDRLEQALRAEPRTGAATGLLLIDLDRFKEVNDALGHHAGDELLLQVGPRLAGVLRAGDTVARLGGDEFAVLLPLVGSLAAAEAVARDLQAALARPFPVAGLDLDVEASIGVVVSQLHGNDRAELMQRADIAMYVAKQRSLGVTAYSPDDDGHSPDRLALLGDLRRALAGSELFLHYQPKVSLSTGQVCGAEALLRWQHPERGPVPPDAFIPVAEGTGLIGPLTTYVLDLALAQARRWLDAGDPLLVAVNLSARNLLDDGLDRLVAGLLERHGVPARLLTLEVTESAIMTDPVRAKAVLARLHALGVSLSIDDFGAGYTSLGQLKDLPLSELKVDRSFVLAMQADSSNGTIVRSVVELGHNLGMTAVAEGVEDLETLERLAGFSCDVAQGYHLSRPLPAEAFDAWRAQWPGLGARSTL